MLPPATDAGGGRTGLAAALGGLLASSTTLVCCVLPALLVTLGAGAVLSSVVSTVPQIVWLSEHKEIVFGVAGVLLAAAAVAQWRARSAPCPIEPAQRAACLRLRKFSARTFLFSLALYAVAGWFAFLAV